MATLPNPNPIPNDAIASYTYVVDPSLPPVPQSNTSTVATTQINEADVISAKQVDKAYADVGDTLTYTITLKNAGNMAAENLILTDTLPTGTSFVPGSATINGVPVTGSPGAGLSVGTIAPGSTTTVVFKVTVGSFPNPNPIPNAATGNYTFTVDPSVPNGQNGTTNTNIVNTQVNRAYISDNTGINKQVSENYAQIGDTLTYTIGVTNTGNVSANNVMFTDTIPQGTTFVPGSATVNGTANAGNPQTGINIGTIPPAGTTTVTFKVVVNTIPTTNPIPNSSHVHYTYIISPTGTQGAADANSNIVDTQVNQAIISNATGGMTKYVDKAYANTGDTLTYTIALKNTGNVPADNVILSDTLPKGTTFVPGSVTANGAPVGGDPAAGVNVGTIAPGAVTTVSFKVVVNTTIPTTNPIPNDSTINFTYTVDPANPDGAAGKGNSNKVNTQVNSAKISNSDGGLTKTVDKTSANVGDTLTYTISMKNTGNVPANNVIFADSIPKGTTFIPGTVTVNGAANAGNPAAGINVGTINPGQTTVVTFQVLVNTTIPTTNPIPNRGAVAYKYTVDPSVPNGASGGGLTNQVTTQINAATIDYSNGGGLNKNVDKNYDIVGDTLTYTIIVKNTGNVPANNVVLTDTIPKDTTYIPSSLTVNGSPNLSDPQTGIDLGVINPGQQVVVQFQVTVDTFPNPNPIPNNSTVNFTYTSDPSVPDGSKGKGNSDTVYTKINEAVIDNANGGLVKSVDKVGAQVGDTLTYTTTIKNTGNVTANNVIFTDTAPNATTFVPGTTKVNGTSNPGNPTTGINVGNIGPNQVVTVSFEVLVTTIPTPHVIPNTSAVAFSYTMNPSIPNGAKGNGVSNQVLTSLNEAEIDNATGGMTKTANPKFSTVGETVTYTITLKNTGTVTADNVVFTDTVPQEVTFIPGTVTVDGTPNAGDPSTGIALGNLAAGQVTTISFDVVTNTLPKTNPVQNTGYVDFVYTVDPRFPDGQPGSGSSNPEPLYIDKAVIDNATGGLNKSVDKSYAKLGDTLTYTATVKNTGNVTANNVIFQDTIPQGTTLIPNSVTVNGAPNAGNPQSGINIGSIGPNQVDTVTFQVRVTTIPAVNPIPNTNNVGFTYTIDPSVPNGAKGKGTSNQVTTQINQASINNPDGGYVKAVTPTHADVGDTITYTLTMTNTGNVPADNVIFQDTIPTGTTFVPGSVTVNGAANAGNPQTGINVGTINPAQTTVITYEVVVNATVPQTNPVMNKGNVSFNYTVDPSVPGGATGGGSTNVVDTQVNTATIDYTNGGGLVKSGTPPYVKLGDTISYTITVNNTGNVTANNVVLTDTLPTDTTYVPSSLTVNGVPYIGNPATGVTIGTIAPNQPAVVQFQVIANTFPNPNPIPNNSTVNFTYTVDPSVPNGGVGTGNSNTVYNQVNNALLTGTKYVDRSGAQIGDTITYTLVLNNTGNTTANNVVLVDTPPNGTVYIPNTLTVNGAANPSDPANGINLGNIAPAQVVTVVFKVSLTTVPTENPIPNTAYVSFTHTVDPSVPNGGSGNSNTNTVFTAANIATFNNVKTATPEYVTVGDTITYTIGLTNVGTTTATNVVFIDTVPSAVTLVPGSGTINGVPTSGNPATGIALPNIGPNQVVTISFKAVANTIPTSNPVVNKGYLNYTYLVDPSLPADTGSSGSNPAPNTINKAVINNANGGLVKSVNKAYTEVGDTLTYTTTIKNTGNVTANNVIFTDTIPQGTVFVPGSLTINGAPNAGNPATGVNVGNVGPNQVETITFKVVVTTIPTVNPIPNTSGVNFTYTIDPSVPNGGNGNGLSNQVTTQINQATIDNVDGGYGKTVDKAYANIGDTLTYTLSMTNTGNVPANNVVFTDTIPQGTNFVPGSVTVNGTANAGNPQTGINVGTINPAQTTVISYQVVVTNTIPSTNPVQNQGLVDFTYTVNPSIPNGQTGNGSTNIVDTQVNHADISVAGGGLVKSADVQYAAIGDTVTYTTTLQNTGNVAANNVVFQDTIPAGTTFVTNSVTVNGAGQTGRNPQTGVPIGTIAPNQIVTVSFEVVVNTTPAVNPIPNQSNIMYNYTVDPSNPNGATANNPSNVVLVQINTAIIDAADGGLVKSVNKAYGDLGDTLTYTIFLKNTGNVPADNVVLYDTIPAGTSLVQNSVTVDGVPQPGANPQTGISLNSIPAGVGITITFQVVVSSVTVPNPNPVPNNSIVTFDFNKCQ